jgi:hypothetical protein
MSGWKVCGRSSPHDGALWRFARPKSSKPYLVALAEPSPESMLLRVHRRQTTRGKRVRFEVPSASAIFME